VPRCKRSAALTATSPTNGTWKPQRSALLHSLHGCTLTLLSLLTHTTSVRLFTTPPTLARLHNSLRQPGRPIPCLAAARRFQAHRHRNQQDLTLRMLICISCTAAATAVHSDNYAQQETGQPYAATPYPASSHANLQQCHRACSTAFCNTDISLGVCYSIQCRHSFCSMHGPCSALLHRVCHRQQTSCTCAPGGEHRW
jgi:hypothetical protein